jgi:hypothetical protein
LSISPHNTNNHADQERWKAKICEMKIVENFKTLTKLAIIDPNSIFDVDYNEVAVIIWFIDMTTSDPVCCRTFFYVDIDNDIS